MEYRGGGIYITVYSFIFWTLYSKEKCNFISFKEARLGAGLEAGLGADLCKVGWGNLWSVRFVPG
ncbi:unnamed protein product [Staurois parvus]|uniref:Uncharacterized protein n=1 Tax=Staurois parvus TaxID=386267 RepID=A0ABN9BSZ9_9NEOB|nr:unnamed protein product [Staurois parvus]